MPMLPELQRITGDRACDCPANHLNCLTAKEWVKNQLGVWQVAYEKRDIRDKSVHPATFPLALAKRVIGLFTHEGEIVLDPFVGSGTTLLAAKDMNRSAVGFDLSAVYVEVAKSRLLQQSLFNAADQVVINDDARNISDYLPEESVALVWTSPPYANTLNRKRQNKSRRVRKNEQYDKVEQYSQDPRDLGTLKIEEYTREMGDIFESLLPVLRPGGHCVVDIQNVWMDNKQDILHLALTEELRRRGFEFRNTIIWDKTNVVNSMSIFGWPSNYIAAS